LKKEICKICHNHFAIYHIGFYRYPIKPWGDVDEDWWQRYGLVSCPFEDGVNRSTWLIEEAPDSRCYFKLEHLVLNQ